MPTGIKLVPSCQTSASAHGIIPKWDTKQEKGDREGGYMMHISQYKQSANVVDRPSGALRPFYFVVVFWGETFRNYLVDYCLPSLVAPGNLPALSFGNHKFIFCTTPYDWKAVSATMIFASLKRYVEPYFVEIPPAPPGKSGCEHMGIGHKLASEMAHRDGAYGVFLTPDLMLSNGAVAALQQHALNGVRVVLVAALRFGEEPLFQCLEAEGVLKRGERASQTGTPIVLTGRQMVAACSHSFHSETLRYEWQASYFSNFPAAVWWRIPDEQGILLHSLSWAPILCDYSAITEHDTTVFNTWTLDGDYVYQNFGASPRLHVVTDSDEMMLVSWAPLADREQRLAPSLLKQVPVLGDLIKGGILRATLRNGLFDPLKLRIFFLPVRWHSGALTPAWMEIEEKALRILFRYAGDINGSTDSHRQGWRICLVVLTFIGKLWTVLAELVQYRSRIIARLSLALRGDWAAWARIGRRIRSTMGWLLGISSKKF